MVLSTTLPFIVIIAVGWFIRHRWTYQKYTSITQNSDVKPREAALLGHILGPPSEDHIPREFQMMSKRPRYRQDEEERLREQISRAETSIGTSSMESSDKLYDLGVLLIAQGRYKTAEEVILGR